VLKLQVFAILPLYLWCFHTTPLVFEIGIQSDFRAQKTLKLISCASTCKVVDTESFIHMRVFAVNFAHLVFARVANNTDETTNKLHDTHQ
jgi:hypothetical protein